MVWTATGGLGPVTLLTNTFMHGGFLHVLLNMWTFCVFGLALS
jgi:membrane associated rhomboid family serine protease